MLDLGDPALENLTEEEREQFRKQSAGAGFFHFWDASLRRSFRIESTFLSALPMQAPG